MMPFIRGYSIICPRKLQLRFFGLVARWDAKFERDFGTFGEVERLDGHERSFDKTRADNERRGTRGEARVLRSGRRAVRGRVRLGFGLRVSTAKFWDACLVERDIGEAVRFAIHFAWDMLDGEVFELAREFRSALVERLQIRAFHFVAALNLANEEFGIAANAQRPDAVAGGVFECGEQGIVFGEIIRFTANIFPELEDDFTARIAQNDGVRRWPGIAARCSINIRDMNACRRWGRMGIGEQASAGRRRNFRRAFHAADRAAGSFFRVGTTALIFTGG